MGRSAAGVHGSTEIRECACFFSALRRSEAPSDSARAGAAALRLVGVARGFNDQVGTHLADALEQLDDRERFMVQTRFLADKEDALSLADVGRQFGVSRERARQLEVRAKAKLRRTLTERCGPDLSADYEPETWDAVA